MDQHVPADAPSDLYITDALDRRPKGAPNYAREARAIQQLAVSMADAPEAVLPKFVDLALDVSGAVAAGLSLLEREPAPGLFRWTFLRGSLSRFEGATTPRHFSPCGITLDRNAPVLTRQPARAYSWISDAGVEAPEVLLVPLQAGDGQPFGTLWVVAGEEGWFTRDHANLLLDLAGCVAFSAARLEHDRRLPA